MFKKILFGSLGVLALGVFFSHKLYKRLNFTPSKLPRQYFLYRQHTIGYAKRKIFNSIKKVQDDIKGLEGNFPNYQFATVYYDHPEKVQTYAEARAVVGIFYQATENNDTIEKFLQEHPEYSVKEISELKTVTTTIPYVSKISEYWLWFVGYGNLAKYLKENNLNGDIIPAVELFSMEGDQVKSITLHYPYEEDIKTLWVTTGPEPRLKLTKS